jgi:hypothetical protein
MIRVPALFELDDDVQRPAHYLNPLELERLGLNGALNVGVACRLKIIIRRKATFFGGRGGGGEVREPQKQLKTNQEPFPLVFLKSTRIWCF